MSETYDSSVESLAEDIRAMAADLKFNTALMVLYTGLMMDRYIDSKTSKYSQNRSRLDIMHTLITHGGTLKPSDLSKMVFRSKQTITKIIDSLEKDGMVKRKPMGKDRRTREVSITRKGLDSIKESLPHTLQISNTAMPTLSQEQMEELNAILRQIRRHLLSQIKNSASER